MFYINTQKKVQPLPEIEIQKILKIPSDERDYKDHQFVFNFFAKNEILKEIERTKSLNARIKCVASIQLIQQQEYTSKLHVLLYIFENMELAIIPIDKKEEALQCDQRDIRKKMDQLVPFTLFSSVKYDQLLFLAQHIQKPTFKYQEFVYRQKDIPEEVYFIQKGEFHILKSQEELENSGKANKKGRKSKIIKLKSLENEEDIIANKTAKKKQSQHKIGIVEGQMGQQIGLEEILNPDQDQFRRYSVICASAVTKVISIHRNFLEIIFRENPTYTQLIKSQLIDKQNRRLENLSRIKTTSMNLPIYLKETEKKDYNSSDIQSFLNSDLNRYKMPPIIQKKDTIVMDYRKKAFSSFLNASLNADEISLKNDRKNANSRRQTIENQQTYDLSISKEYNKNDHQQTRKTIAFPAIHKESQRDDSISKSWSKVDQSNNKNQRQDCALIDSTTLVRDKMKIMAKKITRMTRENLFPPQEIERRNRIINENERVKKEKVCSAHSSKFLEIMLLSALKKAGYEETISMNAKEKSQLKQNRNFSQKSSPHSSMSMPVKKKKSKNNIYEQIGILESSPFDECYFSKI